MGEQSSDGGSVSQDCTITLTPIVVNGQNFVQEVRQCTDTFVASGQQAPPPPPPPLPRALARLTLIRRPSSSCSLRLAIAVCASAPELKVTKPKPRERPVSRSRITIDCIKDIRGANILISTTRPSPTRPHGKRFTQPQDSSRRDRVRRGFARMQRRPINASERMTNNIQSDTGTHEQTRDGGRRAGKTKPTLRRVSSVVFQLRLLYAGMQSASVVRAAREGQHRGDVREARRN